MRFGAEVGRHAGQDHLADVPLPQLQDEIVGLRPVDLVWAGDDGLWKTHWGSFVKPAALLQGVIAAKDVERLIDENVLVFWSHNLDEFAAWVDSQL